jgi:hypothetical protein
MLPEWSHRIAADSVGSNPLRAAITASEEERKNVARRLGILSVDQLEAEFVLTRDSGILAIHVTGVLRAKVTQSCTRTAVPVEEIVSGDIEAWFDGGADENAVSLIRAKRDRQTKGSEREVPILNESEDPEALVNGCIDLGELAVQYLSLGLNPYPRAEGVGDEPLEVIEDANAVQRNPFAALKEWKEKQG